jgi:hypothetical protein
LHPTFRVKVAKGDNYAVIRPASHWPTTMAMTKHPKGVSREPALSDVEGSKHALLLQQLFKE